MRPRDMTEQERVRRLYAHALRKTVLENRRAYQAWLDAQHPPTRFETAVALRDAQKRHDRT